MAKRARGEFVISLDRGEREKPLFLQLYETIRSAILERRLAAGAQLPDGRRGAKAIAIARMATST